MLRFSEDEYKAHLERLKALDEPTPIPAIEKPTRVAKIKSKVPYEHAEQVAFIKWFRLTYPDVRILAIPNGGVRHKKTAVRLKAEGVCPGVPDLFIPKWALWIEFKRQKGSVTSPEQKDWAEYLISIGHKHIFAFGCEDAKRKILNG